MRIWLLTQFSLLINPQSSHHKNMKSKQSQKPPMLILVFSKSFTKLFFFTPLLSVGIQSLSARFSHDQFVLGSAFNSKNYGKLIFTWYHFNIFPFIINVTSPFSFWLRIFLYTYFFALLIDNLAEATQRNKQRQKPGLMDQRL